MKHFQIQATSQETLFWGLETEMQLIVRKVIRVN